MKRIGTFLSVLVMVIGLSASIGASPPLDKSFKSIPHGYSSSEIHVKFREGTVVDDPKVLLTPELLGSIKRITPLFTLPKNKLKDLKNKGEELSGQTLPDLSLWFTITLNDGVDAVDFMAKLKLLDTVELVEPAPLPAPPPAITPDFTSSQGYLGPATNGIDALYSWRVPGGNGSGVKIYDVEYSWNQNHEDISKVYGLSMLLNPGDFFIDPFTDNNHGTAVLGELIADNDTKGVTGIAWGADIGLAPAYTNNLGYNPANAILLSVADGRPGDIILIEQQTCVCGLICPPGTQTNLGPSEWIASVFNAIQTAVAQGIVVVEPAGNGSVDLDQAACGGWFNRTVWDSGAIIVGAGQSPATGRDREREWFSSYGSRVDLQGWGDLVYTTGYGYLLGLGYVNRDDPSNPVFWYTASFGGTSSASPMVAGAAADLQGVAFTQRGFLLSPAEIRQLLVKTGIPQLGNTNEHIGPRPNLRLALTFQVPFQTVLGPSTNWEIDGVGDPFILKEGGTYKMWYAGYYYVWAPPYWQSNAKIGYAESVDGVIWTNRQLVHKDPNDPDYPGTSYYYTNSPWVIKEGSTYRMWHVHRWEWVGGDWSDYISHMASTDGINWGNDQKVLGGSGNYYNARKPTVIREADGTYSMWYHFVQHPAVGVAGPSDIFRANSNDGISWTNEQLVLPSIAGGPEDSVLNPDVVKETDGTYTMYYVASNDIYRARSTDGINWTNRLRFLRRSLLSDIIGFDSPHYFKDSDGNEYLYFTFVKPEAGTGNTCGVVGNTTNCRYYIGRARLQDILAALGAPDLVISSLFAPTPVGAGASMSISDVTQNRLAGSAGASTTSFYLSTDCTLDGGDILLGSRAVPALAGNASNRATTSVTIPAGIPLGTYYIIAQADNWNVVAESNETNNTRCSSAITITGPDLVIGSFFAPASAKRGTIISIADVTQNRFPGAAGASTTGVYLSNTTTGGSLIGSRAVPALAGYSSDTATYSVRIPIGTSPGTWYIIWKADYLGVSGETDSTNNTRYKAITITK
jgi:serine protease